MLNRVSLVGRITRDLELRNSVANNPYVAFTVAVSNYYNGKETTAFIPCFAWNKVAENMARYLKKGSLIAVDGRIQTRTDNSNPNQQMTIVTVNADNVSFLDKKSDASSFSNNNFSSNENNGVLPANNNIENSSNNNITSASEPETSFDGDDAILWD